MNLGPQTLSIDLAEIQHDLDSPTRSFPSVVGLAPASGGSILTGLVASRFGDGNVTLLFNLSALHSIMLKHADAGSIAANRFACPGAYDIIITPRSGALVAFDSTLGLTLLLSNVAPVTIGDVANSAVSPAVVTLGVPELIVIDMPAGATATYEYANVTKIEIIDAWVIKDGAGAGNTVQVTDSADAAITDDMVHAVDKAVTHASTVDKATRVIAAAAGLKVVNTRVGGSSAGQLFLLVIPRA